MNLASSWTERSHRCCSDKRGPRGGRRRLRCRARVARDRPGSGASQRVRVPQPTAGFRLPATCTAWPGKNSQLMAVASTCLECRLQPCLKPPRSAGPGPGPFRAAPTPGDLFIPLDSCSHFKAPVHLLEDFHLGKFYDTW